MPDFKFTPHENGSFVISSSPQFIVKVDKENKALTVHQENGERTAFPLRDSAGPVEQAIFQTEDGHVQIGKVDFLGAEDKIWSLTTTDPRLEYRFQDVDGGGWVGSLDIRDILRSVPEVQFDLTMVPVILYIEGDFINACTIRIPPGSQETPWYSFNQ